MARFNPGVGLLLAGIATALGASLWALSGSEGCSACLRSASLTGDLNLAAVGTGYYLVLIGLCAAWLIRSKGQPDATSVPLPLTLGVLLAAGVHSALLLLLVKNRIVCPPCLVTAVGALLACGTLLAQGRPQLRRAAVILPLAAAVTFGGTRMLRARSQSDFVRQAKIAAYTVFEERRAVPAGRAVMVVYMRPTCHVCAEFKQQVVSALRNEFPGLTVEERKAWKGLATPTTVVLGKKNSLFIGYEGVGGMRQAVQVACGAVSQPLPRTAIHLP